MAFAFFFFFFPFGPVLVADFLKIFYESLSGGQGLKLFSLAMPKYSSLLGFLVLRFLHVAEALPFSLALILQLLEMSLMYSFIFLEMVLGTKQKLEVAPGSS